MKQLLRRAWYFIRQRRIEAELAEEMALHREMKQRELEEGGLGPVEAALAARRELGNVTLAREDARATWIRPWLESVWQDAAYTARTLRRQPGFAVTVIAVLSLAIGLNTSLFTVVAGLLLRPWPGVRDPSRVVLIDRANSSGQASGFSIVDARYLDGHATSLAGVTAMRPEVVSVGSDEDSATTSALLVSGNFFSVLDVSMARGRGFLASEDRLGAPRPVTVLAYDFWRRRFGEDVDAVGKTIRVNDVLFTIVGVTPPELAAAEPAANVKLFLPMTAVTLLRRNDAFASDLLFRPDFCCSDVAARLAPGATRAQARAELNLLSGQLESPAETKTLAILVTGTEFASHPGRKPILELASLVFVGLLLVWLIACANIGNLLLARAAARVREIGIRLSLGASRLRIVRQLLTEGFVLAVAASAIGIGLAYELPPLVLRAVANDASGTIPFSVRPDGLVLVYALALAGLSSVAFGLAPALHATRTEIARALTERDGAAASRFSLRGWLLAIQVAVSVVLLVSAALLARGVRQMSQSFDPGFSLNVTIVSFDLPSGTYDEARTQAFFASLTEALRSSAVGAFGFASHEPFALSRSMTGLRLPGEAADQAKPVTFLKVSPAYLDVLHIPLVAGRNFEPADLSRPVVMINEAMARRYWPDQNPIGATLVLNLVGACEIVGVVRNVHTGMVGDVQPLFYQPSAGGRTGPFVSKLIVRTGAVPSDAIASIVTRIDPRVRVQTTSLASILKSRMDSRRYGPLLAGVLGAFALVLATVGMFGVFAYAVRQRTREIGIRMALGAEPSAVVRLVLAGHSRAVVAGLAVGLLGALAASIVLRSRLHGVSPFDPIAYGTVAVILTIAGLAASYVPARRATRIDPVVALRNE